MALLYDAFGVRRVQVVANIWPDIDNFGSGELSRLYGHLNADDLFSSFELRSNMGARMEGEHWVYDISPSSILLRASAFATTDQLRKRIRSLLAGTRQFFDRSYMAFYTEDVRVYGVVPDDKDRHVGEVVKKRLLQRLAKDDVEAMTGLAGAGLRLVGDTEAFHWHAQIEPPHGAYSVLALEAHAMFRPTPDPPTPGDDLDTIDEQVQATYDFLNDDVRTFASKLFH